MGILGTGVDEVLKGKSQVLIRFQPPSFFEIFLFKPSVSATQDTLNT
jgi:hypothetical protein